jgi:hypothetical protein
LLAGLGAFAEIGMPMEFYQGRPLEPEELEAIRQQIEQFDTIEAIVIDVKEMFVQMRASVKFGVAPLARVLKLRNIGGTGSSPHEGVVGMRSRIHAVAVMAIFLISTPAWIAPAAVGSPRPPTDVSAQRHYYHYRHGYYRPTLPYDGYPPYPPPIYRCTYYGPFPLYPYCFGW